jgi:hypothetical protein
LLTRDNIQQIFDEHRVFELDPEAEGQFLVDAVFGIGVQRGEALGREPRLEDGVFAAWAICIPMFPQPESYTELMRARRREFFSDVSPDDAFARGRQFFPSRLLRLQLHGLGNMVTAEDAAQQIQAFF